MVVILVILATLVTSAASGVIQSWKIKQTASTLQVLGQAIEEFKNQYNDPRRAPYYYRYGPFPPDAYLNMTEGDSLIEEFNDLNNNNTWDWCEPVEPGYDYNPNGLYDPGSLRHDFAGAFETQWNPAGAWVAKPANYFDLIADDFNSIESLCLYLSRLCPNAANRLEHLASSGQVTNQDKLKQGGGPAPDALLFLLTDRNGNGRVDPGDSYERVDLREVIDSWRCPLRYQVRKLVTGDWQWELRSAGPDGKFAEMWTPQEQSDDVVLRGP